MQNPSRDNGAATEKKQGGTQASNMFSVLSDMEETVNNLEPDSSGFYENYTPYHQSGDNLDKGNSSGYRDNYGRGRDNMYVPKPDRNSFRGKFDQKRTGFSSTYYSSRYHNSSHASFDDSSRGARYEKEDRGYYTKCRKRILCQSVLDNVACRYGDNCKFANTLDEQAIDADKKEAVDVLLTESKTLEDIDLVKNKLLYQNFIRLNNFCPACASGMCKWGYNCNKGACIKKLLVCEKDLYDGKCERTSCSANHLTKRGLIPYATQMSKSGNGLPEEKNDQPATEPTQRTEIVAESEKQPMNVISYAKKVWNPAPRALYAGSINIAQTTNILAQLNRNSIDDMDIHNNVPPGEILNEDFLRRKQLSIDGLDADTGKDAGCESPVDDLKNDFSVNDAWNSDEDDAIILSKMKAISAYGVEQKDDIPNAPSENPTDSTNTPSSIITICGVEIKDDPSLKITVDPVTVDAARGDETSDDNWANDSVTHRSLTPPAKHVPQTPRNSPVVNF